ncbi:BMC domain-containing protein [Cytobacillus spongiae]|jgi:microcompartment protein CcmL/EutN|uniref:BMC domain-containing protein n=1 Tax=Cytobacillus spongiae TaxID=2901381 RepID=UPI001F3AEC69|nr:BMC domain-containing protein [Cytobacillus spongiae]UII55515.1 BMC domain-containing protein [Cytobacillus spongiae]
MLYQSLGIIEVIGIATATSCIDTMVKSAFVEVESVQRVGSGFIAIMVRGDLASVQVAVERGAEAAQRLGEVAAVSVIPRPYDGLEALIGPEKKGDQK